jgi:pimeloyl-ACP methyl ester carboxylesterase
VLGISGGAPYALACAAALPDRVKSASCVCGVGPPDAQGMNEGMMANLVRFGRRRWQFAPLILLGRHLLWRRDAEQRFILLRRRMNARLSADVPKERAIATDELARHLFVSWREGLRRSIMGTLSDARIYATRWSFRLNEIRTPVHLWHGTQDRVVPVSVGRHYERSIPRIDANFEDGHGHFSVIFNALPKIVQILTAEAA